MIFDFDENPPTAYYLQVAIETSQSAQQMPLDWKWLEKFIPYDSQAESYVHWFKRFP